MSVLDSRVLVLNRGWQPVEVTTARRAVGLVYQDRAQVLDPFSYQTLDFENWVEARDFARRAVHTLRMSCEEIALPEVIVLNRFTPYRSVGCTRRGIFTRDQNTCQYCGTIGRRDELTIDHVVPRSRGGRSLWENLVVACAPCNGRKGARLPKEAKMQLIREPRRPSVAELAAAPAADVPASWEAFLGELYWRQPLDE